MNPCRAAAACATLAAALAVPAFAQTPLPDHVDPDQGFRCSWQDVTPRERASLPTDGLVLERPYLSLRLTEGVMVPLEACGELVGIAWKGTGEADVADPGLERGHRLHDRMGNVPGLITLDAVLLMASDGAVDELVSAAGGAWEETPLPLVLRTMISARIASFDPIDGRSVRPPGEILWAPEPGLGGLLVELRSQDFKRSFKGRLDLPMKWMTYEWSTNGRYVAEPGALYVRAVGPDDPLFLTRLASPSVLASDNPYGLETGQARFDLKDVQAHLLFEPTPGLDRDLTNIKAVSRLELEAHGDGFATIPLWLAAGRQRTLGEQYGALTVGGVKVDDVGARFHRVGGRLFVELPEPSVDGQVYVLEVSFRGPLVEPIGQSNITALTGTYLHPVGHYGDRFAFSSMVTAPKFWKIASTGRVLEEVETVNAVTVTSRCKRPVSEALVFVIDARTEVYAPPAEGLPLLRISRATDTMAVNAKMAEQIYGHLTVLADLLGPFPYDELEIVERRVSRSYVDSPGVITVPIFDAPPDQVLTSRAGRVTLLQALARQYVSADMGAKTYHDRWLVEGLAVQAECYMLEAAGSPGRCAGALRSMRDAWTEMVFGDSTDWLIGPLWMGTAAGGRPVGAFGDPNTQARGPLVLHRLRLLLGDAMNRTLIRRVATSYRGQPLNTLSFLIQAQAVAGVDLRSFFYGWVYATPQQPTLRLLWQAEEVSEGSWTLHLGGMIDAEREGDPLPFVSPTMVRIKYGKNEAWQRIVLTHEAQDFTIEGIPEEPKNIDVDWQTFPGKVEIKKQKK